MIEQILQQVLQGASAPPSRSRRAPAGDPMAEILGSILGTGSARPSVVPSGRKGTEMGLIGDLIGEIMGTPGGQGRGRSSGGLVDLLGMVIGAAGGSAAAGNNPLVRMIAKKLRIPPAIAGMIISYFVAKMVKGRVRPGDQTGRRRKPKFLPEAQRKEESLDLDHLLERADDKQELGGLLEDSGMAEELSKQAGINQEQAREGLEIILSQLAKQRQKPKAPPKRPASMKGLLDTWQC